MEPAFRSTHNMTGIIHKKTMFIGVAEIIETDDGLATTAIKGPNDIAIGVHPDELTVSLSSLLSDQLCVGLAVFLGTACVA